MHSHQGATSAIKLLDFSQSLFPSAPSRVRLLNVRERNLYRSSALASTGAVIQRSQPLSCISRPEQVREYGADLIGTGRLKDMRVAERRSSIHGLAVGAFPENEKNTNVWIPLGHPARKLESGHLLHLRAANESADLVGRILDESLAGSGSSRMKHLVPGGTEGSQEANPAALVVVGEGNERRTATRRRGPLRAASAGRRPARHLTPGGRRQGNAIALGPGVLSAPFHIASPGCDRVSTQRDRLCVFD